MEPLSGVRVRAIVACVSVALLAGVVGAQDAREAARGERLWVFLAQDSPGTKDLLARAAHATRQAHGVQLRVALLVRDFGGLAAWNDDRAVHEWVATLQELPGLENGIGLFDEEGLRLARQLGIDRFPAVALLDGTRARVAYGAGVDIAEVLK